MFGYILFIKEPSVTARRVLFVIASVNQVSSPTEMIPSHIHVLSHFSRISQMVEGVTSVGGGGEYDFTL
jgi:hypothetical protein